MTGENIRPHDGVAKIERQMRGAPIQDGLVTDAIDDTPRPKLSAAKGLVYGILLSGCIWAAIIYFVH